MIKVTDEVKRKKKNIDDKILVVVVAAVVIAGEGEQPRTKYQLITNNDNGIYTTGLLRRDNVSTL